MCLDPVVVGLLDDLQSDEECLVQESSDLGTGVPVGPLAVGEEIECEREVALDGLGVGLCGAQLGLHGLQLAGDAVLFGLEQVEGDGAGVVGLEQLLPLGEQPLAVPLGGSVMLQRLGFLVPQLVAQPDLDGVA
ncbi:MAG: hypothetical protein ACFCUP_08595 [Actinomycetales bacterium]